MKYLGLEENKAIQLWKQIIWEDIDHKWQIDPKPELGIALPQIVSVLFWRSFVY